MSGAERPSRGDKHERSPTRSADGRWSRRSPRSSGTATFFFSNEHESFFQFNTSPMLTRSLSLVSVCSAKLTLSLIAFFDQARTLTLSEEHELRRIT